MQVRDLIELLLNNIRKSERMSVVTISDAPDGEAHKHSAEELPQVSFDSDGKLLLIFHA